MGELIPFPYFELFRKYGTDTELANNETRMSS